MDSNSRYEIRKSKNIRLRGALDRYVRAIAIDAVLIDVGPIPTEVVSDFAAGFGGRLIGAKVPEDKAEKKEYMKGFHLSWFDYFVSTIITALFEFEPTSGLNNTLGILVNPAGVRLVREIVRSRV